MVKRYDLLDKVKEWRENGTESVDPNWDGMKLERAGEILDVMLWYCVIRDSQPGSVFSKTFERLYISKEPIVSYDAVAYELGLSTRTLDRHRHEFNDLFIYLSKNLESLKEKFHRTKVVGYDFSGSVYN